MGKKALLQRVRAALAKKRRTTNSVKTKSRTPRMEFDMRTKVFAPLPHRMGVKQPFQTDPRWDVSAVTGMGITPGIPSQTYMFLDLINMNQPTNRGPIRAYWHNTSHYGLCNVYQEFSYSMTYLHGTMYLDAIYPGVASAAVQTVQVAVAVVPLTFLRDRTGTGHSPADTGTFYSGVDYFSMISGMPNCKIMQLVSDGSTNPKFNLKIDSFDHFNARVRAECTVANNLVNPATGVPRVDVTYPTFADQEVALFAFRWLARDGTQFQVRANLTCDQHFAYSNPRPTTQYLVYDQATGQPDNQ